MNPLKQLEQCGQSPWLDYVSRGLLSRGEVKTLVERDGLKGMTSNPSIFEKAIGESDEYLPDLRRLLEAGDQGVGPIYEHLAIGDIRAAADALRPVFDASGGRDGYISLEVSPYLAHDTAATIAEARRLWKAVDRRNLMVKVPATPEGIPAIRQLIEDGLNINITLLFAVAAYQQVAEAYIAGLEARVKAGQPIGDIASVASFFVSRIDSAVDKAVDAKTAEGGDKAALEALRGKVAIANAKRAYALYKKMFADSRWNALAAKGAKTQRLLWASTSTKNPKYRDTIYVEELIGRDTVNTMPPATMDAFRDHGVVQPDAIERDLEGAEATMAALEKQGISMQAITEQLVEDGVRQFADAFDKLLGAVARRRRTMRDGDAPRQTIRLGDPALEKAVADEMDRWRKEGGIRRLWAADKSLWTGADEEKWLGWLTIVDEELSDIDRLIRFAGEVRDGGYTDVVLLGMGGSSLGPEVLSETLGPVSGWPRFHMLDSTDPAQIRTLEAAIDISRTLFIVSSKSGSTLEPNIFKAFFFDRVQSALGNGKAGPRFVAVTDPGSSMEKAAAEQKFAHIFHGVKSIGGRYSVLSKFGLVPGAAMGVDIERLLRITQEMVRACGPEVPPAENPGVQLGVAMGVLARSFGRDKVTVIASPGIADLGAWLEQLLAESTGKQGHGLVPVDAEPLGAPDRYGKDRFFAYVELDGEADAEQQKKVAALEQAGHPVARIRVADPYHIGCEFFRWEMATAVAGAVIGINPFDQPDVEAAKVKARELTDAYEKNGSLPEQRPIFRHNGLALYTDQANAGALGSHNTLEGYLKSHLGRAGAGDYVALLAYIERNEAHTDALQNIRLRIRDRLRVATCLGFGPRFQHSTGQAYKGGPNSGVFLQITCKDEKDLAVPGHSYSFGVVKAAQARGDLDVLLERKRRALRVDLENVESGLAELARAVDQALS